MSSGGASSMSFRSVNSTGAGISIRTAPTGTPIYIGTNANINSFGSNPAIVIGPRFDFGGTEYFQHIWNETGGGVSRHIQWIYRQNGAVGGCRAGAALSYTAGTFGPLLESSNCDTIYTSYDLKLRSGTTLSTVAKFDARGFNFPFYTGGITGTHATSASFTSSGALIQVPEKWAAISTSTDGSGDIVVAHGMGVTPTSVQVTVTGTTPYVVTVHTIGGTNFTVRFYDMTGAAVASTAVTATWHCKT
jgi:hypothetical protein